MRTWSRGCGPRSTSMRADPLEGKAEEPGGADKPAGTVLATWDRIEQTLIGLLAAYGLFAAMYQTVTRYAFPEWSGEWSDETTVYALIWAVFLASSSLAARDGHVRADLFLRIAGERTQRGMEIVNTLVALIFTIFLAYYGVLIAWEGYLWDERSMTTFRFPMWIYFASVPAGAILMVLRYLRRLHVLLFTSGPAIQFEHHDPVNVD